MSRVLIIAKEPWVGRAKTRLVPPLTPHRAAELAAAMLLDTVAGCRREVSDVGLLCAGHDEAAALASLVGGEPRLIVQRERGLRAALRTTMRAELGGGPLAIVSSDVPGTPAGEVAAAFAALAAGADVVLGPSFDGGYWLIAMAAFHEAPFDDIPWSTSACRAVTIARATAAGLRVHELAPWLDIDTSADLIEAQGLPRGAIGERSAAVLATIGTDLATAPHPPRLEKSELVVATPWRSVIRDRLIAPGGGRTDYTYLAVPRAVFVVAVTDDEDVLLVRQYRHPVRDLTLEVPAGSVTDGETPLAAARRELAEEVGGASDNWRHLGTFFSSSAHLSLRSDAFLATGVRVGEARPEDGEDLAVVRMPVAAALARAREGSFVEGQTALALLLAARHLEPVGPAGRDA